MNNPHSRTRPTAYLALADGSVFKGYAIGAKGQSTGEVVFNTAMTGYQEILTDPSYTEQIVTLTYPHIGNVGINLADHESDKVWAAGLVIRELSPIVSNWRASSSLEDYLIEHNVVAIAGVDTRALTHLLRTKGAQNGSIIVADEAEAGLKAAQAYSGLHGKDLAKMVSTKTIYSWDQGSYDLDSQSAKKLTAAKRRVVVYDFGVKQEILRMLVDRDCEVTVVPAQTSVDKVLALKPDGILLSNGPGDPAACDYAIAAIRELLQTEIPLFGICLGFQLLGLACGAKTLKMKFGHHGANHPVKDLELDKVLITSQNHGFAVDKETLPADYQITHISLFDQTLQGFRHRHKPVIAFQGHPEASPGPHDIAYLFDHFITLMER